MIIRGWAGILLLPVASCSAPSPDGGAQSAQQVREAASDDQASAEPQQHPESGLEVIPLQVISEGKTHDFLVEMARSPQEQAKGLMFRRQLGPNEGMLFPREPPSLASFWMKNTVISLDIIFIGRDRKVRDIARDTMPYSLDSVVSDGPVAAVLEIPGGRAAELGIQVGAKVDW